MPLHESYTKPIEDFFKAMKDHKLIPSDRPLKDGLYDYKNELDPSIKFAMAAHNYVQNFNNINSIPSLVLSKTALTDSATFIFSQKITDKTSYFVMKFYLAFLNALDLNLINLPKKILDYTQQPLAICKQSMASQINDFLNLYEATYCYADINDKFSRANEGPEKIAVAKEALLQIAKSEKLLEEIKLAIEFERAFLQSKNQSTQEFDDYHARYLRRIEQFSNLKIKLKDCLPKKSATDYFADLKNHDTDIAKENELTNLTNYRDLITSTEIKNIHTINYKEFCTKLGLSEAETALLNPIQKAAEKEASLVGRIRNTITRSAKESARTIYKEILQSFLNIKLEGYDIQKAAVDGIQESIAVELDQLKNKLINQCKSLKTKKVDTRFFLIRFFKPLPTIPIHVIKAVQNLKTALENKTPATTNILDLIKLLKNESEVVKRLLPEQRNAIVILLNMAQNYLDKLILEDAISINKSNRSTRSIMDELSICIKPSIQFSQKPLYQSSPVKTTAELIKERPKAAVQAPSQEAVPLVSMRR